MRKIQRNICREDAISRIPAMFAYVEYDDNGGSTVQPAARSRNGCYGQMVEALEVPCGLIVDGEVVLRDHSVCSYRQMMNVYYQYRDDERVGRFHPFIKWVERGIGLIDVMVYAEQEGFVFDEEPILMPQHVYLANVMYYIEKMMNLKRDCIMFENEKAAGRHNETLCCRCEDYKNMGGDTMLDLLLRLSEEFESRSTEYYGWARAGQGSFILNIPLFTKVKDMGVLEAYEDELQAITYPKGAIVTVTKVDEDGYYDGIDAYNVKPSADQETVTFDVSDPCTGEISQEALQSRNVSIDSTIALENINSRSRLSSLRSGRQYIQNNGVEIRPSDGQDWLWYYKLGNKVANKVERVYYNTRKRGDNYYGDRLHEVWLWYDKDGDNVSEAKIRFVYWVDEQQTTEEMDPNEAPTQVKVYSETHDIILNDAWKTLISDWAGKNNVSPGGDSFVEVRGVQAGEESDLYTLLTTTDGLDYKTEGTTEYVMKYDDRRFPFDVSRSMDTVQKDIGGMSYTTQYVKAQYNVKMVRDWAQEAMNSPIFKDDRLSSLTFKPDVHSDVHVQRGSAAAFERHIRLSEVKTMDDLMQYANGGYYTIERLT